MTQEALEKLDGLYGQIYELSIMIGQLIDRKQFINIDNYVDLKENLFKEAEVLIKEIGENADYSQFSEICQKIQEQESANITSLTCVRDEIKKEIQNANKKSKLVNAYSNTETKQGNLLDMRE